MHLQLLIADDTPFSPPGPESDLPVRVYGPQSEILNPSKLLWDTLHDISAGRELAWRLFTRDIKAQYRQTYFGYLWAFIPPLVGAITFIFLQSQGITNIEGTLIPYPVFVMIGTMLWQTFADATMSPLQSINGARSMLVKLNFPREAILMAGMYIVTFNMLVRLILLAVVMVVWRVSPGMTLLAFPVSVFGLLACGFGIGMLILPIGSLYGDIARGFPILLQFGMFLTPVVYPARTEGFAGWLATWNPLAPLIETGRSALTGQPIASLQHLVAVLMASLLVCFVSVAIFRLTIPHLIERMGG